MHVFALEKMPCIDAYIPARSVKGWFLSQSVAAQFEDEQGCKLSLQKNSIFRLTHFSVR